MEKTHNIQNHDLKEEDNNTQNHTYHKKSNAKKDIVQESNLFKYGSFLFIVGILICIIGTFLKLDKSKTAILLGILIIIGIIIGLFNITKDKNISFLISSLVFVTVLTPFLGLLNQYFITTNILGLFFTYLVAMVAPASLVVAIKTIIIPSKK